MTEPLLRVDNLSKFYPVKSGNLFGSRMMRAVDGVGFDLRRGETIAVVGESGCGKSTTARMVSGLLAPTSGSIRVNGKDIARVKGREAFALRRQVQMVFQDPMASLNARMKVRTILEEPLIIHSHGNRTARRQRVEELMGLVGLRTEHLDRYPHQFSGGQRQRIGIARALAVEPELLVLDEPVSALDVSVQAQIINLLKDLQTKLGLSYVFIAHDLAVVKHMADHIAVMYLGRIIEQGPKAQIFDTPRHPYTQMLFSAVPQIGLGRANPDRAVKGEMPSPVNPPKGCHFNPRCPFSIAACWTTTPNLVDVGTQKAACIRADEIPVYATSGNAPSYTVAAEKRMNIYHDLINLKQKAT